MLLLMTENGAMLTYEFTIKLLPEDKTRIWHSGIRRTLQDV
jgi:hypothetical protein